MISPEKCLELYLSLRSHFQTEKYDAIKNNGRAKGATRSILEARNDCRLIEHFARKFGDVREAASFFVANMAYGNQYPFSNEEKSFKNYTKWQRNRQSLSKMFSDDIYTIEKTKLSISELVSTQSGMPPLFLLMKNGKINIETVAIINQYQPFIETWKKELPLWKSDFLRIGKLGSFIKTDETRFKKLYLTIEGNQGNNHETL